MNDDFFRYKQEVSRLLYRNHARSAGEIWQLELFNHDLYLEAYTASVDAEGCVRLLIDKDLEDRDEYHRRIAARTEN